MENQIEQILSTALQKIKSVTDVDTVIGHPVNIGDGAMLIPVSKVTFGFLAGGGEYGDVKKIAGETNSQFAGGSGGAVTISPIGFLVSKGGNVRVASLTPASNNTMDKIWGFAGDIMTKFTQKKGAK